MWDKQFKRNDDLNVGMFLGQFERILPFYMKFSVCPNCLYARITPGHYIIVYLHYNNTFFASTFCFVSFVLHLDQ